ncbi:MAG: hypothetical protein HY744_26585 [Deltaproteobacteria bacterium]|nr:hypothetical protein [Deltaproteobacteria bacterium]
MDLGEEPVGESGGGGGGAAGHGEGAAGAGTGTAGAGGSASGCADGEQQPCYSGAPATKGVGVCAPGQQICVGGEWDECAGEVVPGGESCDGKDNDCDGKIDDGNPEGGGGCATGLPGICSAGTMTCQSGSLKCVQKAQAGPEACGDGQDNDCDGKLDNGCFDPPAVGYMGTAGRLEGAVWKVCRADDKTAWLAANDGGKYDAPEACQSVGYKGADKKGGHCGTVCGYCGQPGLEKYDDGGGAFESLSWAVHWRCYR